MDTTEICNACNKPYDYATGTDTDLGERHCPACVALAEAENEAIARGEW